MRTYLMPFSRVSKKDGHGIRCSAISFLFSLKLSIDKVPSVMLVSSKHKLIPSVSFRHCQLPTYAILKFQLWWPQN